MNTCICNKCFVTIERGKSPFHLTECGHVYCTGCLPQAKKQCPQCEHIDAQSFPLQQPLQPKITQFFLPITESLIELQKRSAFQVNQMDIMMHRFLEIDKKYEILKAQYYKIVQHTKALSQQYNKEKSHREALEKKLMYYKMQSSAISSSSNISTPDTIKQQRMKYTPSTDVSRSVTRYFITPSNKFNPNQKFINSDGFRVPDYNVLRKSAGSSGRSGKYNFNFPQS